MTELEMKKLDEVVSGVKTTAKAELAWIQEQFPSLLDAREKMAFNYRLQRFLREDEQCKKINAELSKINVVIEYLEKRKAELTPTVV